MKKLLALLMTVCMLLPAAALAETDLTDRAIANGVVTAASFVDVTAPFSGTLAPFDWAAGDTVAAGDALFSLLTTTVYATEDGTVDAVFAAAGDDASAVTARFGGVVALEPAESLQIQATTAGAYNDEDNRRIHAGETLYFRSAKADREEGSGRVAMVSGNGYVVDILEGDFDLNENLTLYRDDGYAAKHNVGKGTVMRRDPVLHMGSGRIAAVHVAAGDKVRAGAPLFDLMAADAAPGATPTVAAPADGVIASVAVGAGQQVWKGQVLARLYLTDQVEVVAEVDEMDLGDLRVGDSVPVTLDMNEDQVITGEVTEISALGVTRQNAAYFTVRVSIPAARVLLGASASIYLER